MSAIGCRTELPAWPVLATILLCVGCSGKLARDHPPDVETEIEALVWTSTLYRDLLEFAAPGDVKSWHGVQVKLTSSDAAAGTATFEWLSDCGSREVLIGTVGESLQSGATGKIFSLSELERVDPGRVVLALYWESVDSN